VVEFLWSLRNMSHIPEGVGLLGTTVVTIGPPGTVVVRTGSVSLLSNINTHVMSRWCGICLVFASEPDISGGSVVEFLWGLRNMSHIPEGISLFGTSVVSIRPPGTVVVWTGLGVAQVSLMMLVVVFVMMLVSVEASLLNNVDAHWVTGWRGIESVETADLRFSSEAPELLWRAGSSTHVCEVIVFLRSTSVAVTPAVGGWFDTVENDTSVEVISVVSLSLPWGWAVAGLSERSSSVDGRVSSGISREGGVTKASLLGDIDAHWMTGWCGIESVETTDLRFSCKIIELLSRTGSHTHVSEVVILLRTTSVSISPGVGRWLNTVESDTSVEVISVVGLSLPWGWAVASLGERRSGVECGVSRGISCSISSGISREGSVSEASLLNNVDAHWVTGWRGIESVETADLRFSSEAPELLSRSGSSTHVSEVIVLLRTTSIAVAPAVGRWLNTIKNDTSVEMITVVGLTLPRGWTIASLHKRRSVLGRVRSDLGIGETIVVFLWLLVTTVVRKVSDVKSMIFIKILFNVLSNHILSVTGNFLRWVITFFFFNLIVIILFHVSSFVVVSVVQVKCSSLLNGDDSEKSQNGE